MARRASLSQAELALPSAGEEPWPLEPGATVIPGGAVSSVPAVLEGLGEVLAASPLRSMETPGGYTMSVRMSSCGSLGWVTSRAGYRYAEVDPLSGAAWPAMPKAFLALASRLADRAGHPGFVPDSCLINEYGPGARMSLHQDKDERSFEWPIVSVSLGLSATFLWGGERRSDRPRRVPLVHGDAVVFGGPARLRYHGVAPVRAGVHPVLGDRRVNLTFRRAG